MKYHRPAPIASFCTQGPYQISAPLAWEQMRLFVREHDLRTKVIRAIGYYMDDPADVASEHIRYTACIDVGANPPCDPAQAIHEEMFPGGVYASLDYKGETSGVGRVFSQLKRQWLPSQPVELDSKRPFLEIYDTSNSLSYHGDFAAELGIPVLTSMNPQTMC